MKSILVVMTLVVGFLTLNLFAMKNRLEHKPKAAEHLSADQPFRPYLEDFVKGAKEAGVEEVIKENLNILTIKFGKVTSLDASFAAYCERMTTTIIVDRAYWSKADEATRQAALDHELGHCLLDRIHRHVAQYNINNQFVMINLYPQLVQGLFLERHLDLKDAQINPVSIMYPLVLRGQYYAANKADLRKELFEKRYLQNHNRMEEVARAHAESAEEMNQMFFVNYTENLVNRDPETVDLAVIYQALDRAQEGASI